MASLYSVKCSKFDCILLSMCVVRKVSMCVVRKVVFVLDYDKSIYSAELQSSCLFFVVSAGTLPG